MSLFSTIESDIATDFSDVVAWVKSFGGEGKTVSQDVVTDIQLISTGLTAAASQFEAITGIAPELVSTIATSIASIAKAAESVAATVATNVAEPMVMQISTDYAALQAALKGVTLPAVLTSVLSAVTTLLPYVLAAVGTLSAASVSASKETGMSQDVARLILKAA